MEENVLPPEGGKLHADATPPSQESNNNTNEAIKPPKEFCIEEVDHPTQEGVERGGTIQLEFSEKQKMRAFLTYTLILFWLSWTAVGIIHFLFTGNWLLLITSPPLGVVLQRAFQRIIDYYFK